MKGNKALLEPAKIVVYGFSVPVESKFIIISKLTLMLAISFVFNVMNPTLSSSLVIPVTIYALTGTTLPLTKKYHNYLPEGIVLVTNGI